MKYTDEEMAEAALMLSQTDTSQPMPAALEATLLERSRTVASEMRFSTTKAGVVEIDAPVPSNVVPIGRASRMGRNMGWIAAAACFAFAIYEWRAKSVEGSHNAAQPTEAASRLVDAQGQAVAEIDGDAKVMKVIHLPAKPGQRYQLWTSTSDAAHAVAAGSFACEPPSCDGRELAFAPGARPVFAWVTTVNGTEAGRPTDSSAIIGSGGISGTKP